MSIVLRKVLDGENEIFFRNPGQIRINATLATRYLESATDEVLIDELREKGPMIGYGKMGPSAYATPPVPWGEPIGELTIYGWEPGVVHLECENQYFLIVGAQKIQSITYVYFMLSSEIVQRADSFDHIYQISDPTIYAISHEIFKRYLLDLYAPKKSEFWRPYSLSVSLPPYDQSCVNQLLAISPIGSILGSKRNLCIHIGSEIFNCYKEDRGGYSFAGLEAMQRICNALILAEGNSIRWQYVKEVWEGIGDTTCWWKR